MISYKQFNNGLRIVLNKMEGFTSVSIGVYVKTGSVNETEKENGLSHFIEHVLFKGTNKRTAFEISDHIDRIGGQINAFTSKETTCFYTKSTAEHIETSLEILSDIFFNSKFDTEELEKEKGVVIEEINMCEDSPEDICMDLLSESYFGKEGLGRTILGPAKNIKRFTREDVLAYMNKYYTADNVVISIAGNIDIAQATSLVEKYFADRFKVFKSAKQAEINIPKPSQLCRSKKLEQTHIGFVMKGYDAEHPKSTALSIASSVLGGGMSSRLFQKVREELGLCYSIYSYPSFYKDNGILEIYAGVNTASRDLAVNAIVEEVLKLKKEGVTEQEFLRCKEQGKTAYIFSRESVYNQMIIFGKHLLITGKEFDYQQRMKEIEDVTLENVQEVIEESFNILGCATATVGSKRTPIKV